MEQDGTAGSCPLCGAPHSRGAVFCWQCGATLMEEQVPRAAPEEEPTQVFHGAGEEPANDRE